MNVYETLNPMKLLENNTYPGRGIIIGKTPDGKNAVIAYFIMGRSENSRNRVFEQIDGGIITKAYDESKLKDPSLIIYAPVRTLENKVIVTNGDQTDTVYDFVKNGSSFEDALRTREFEPDAPNFTPRISGMLTFENNDFSYKMSILKSADEKGGACSRYFYEYPALSGVGHFIHTYNCDGDPIPTFTGEPERVLLQNDIDGFADALWSSLNADNKISLYVRYTDLNSRREDIRIINKNK
ncbi:MAG: IMP cyclohydrolase [Clostridia bacterium]|nr:IMP cyclohydrolase [Clostridia bacterium]